MTLKNMRILVEDNGQYYKVGKVDTTDEGRNVYVTLDNTYKASRHGDGNVWAGPIDRSNSSGRSHTLCCPTSDITQEVLCNVALSSDLTVRGTPYDGPKITDGSAFTFSSTALASSNVAFGAQIVDNGQLSACLEALHQSPGVVSASTYRETGLGKSVVLWVSHSS